LQADRASEAPDQRTPLATVRDTPQPPGPTSASDPDADLVAGILDALRLGRPEIASTLTSTLDERRAARIPKLPDNVRRLPQRG
jgi:hypothetical protein